MPGSHTRTGSCGSTQNPGRQGRVRDEKLSVAMIVEASRRPGMAVLAFEPGRSLLLEQEACETLVKKNKLSVLTVG